MENNPHNLKVGDTAILDKDYKGCEKEVIILNITEPTQLFCHVIGLGETEACSVMTARLTPKNGKD